MARRQPFEMPHILGEAPREAIADTDYTVLRYRGDDGDGYTATFAGICGCGS